MLLSIKYRFLFVHIAKTGGTSVRAALQPLRWRDPWYYPMWWCSRLSRWSGHRLGSKFPRHARIVAAKEMLPEEFYSELFKFAVVRNPWDLQVSSWYHLKRERPQLVEHCKDFEAFLRWKLDPERPYQYHVDTSIQQQSDYLIDLHGKLQTDYLGRYEHLEESFSDITQRIGVKGLTLPHKRKATQRAREYRSYYTDALAELLAMHFKQDISLLEYQFDPSSD